MTRPTESVRRALDQYCLSKGEPLDTLETGIIGLLTDLLHLAQTEGQDGFMLVQTAQMHFLVETEHTRKP